MGPVAAAAVEVRHARPEDSAHVVRLLIAQLREHQIPVSERHVVKMVGRAAVVMLRNHARGNAMSRHRVGLALPVGMTGHKPGMPGSASTREAMGR
jgi:hypothetical protein